MTQLINYRLLEFGIGGNIYTTEIGYKSRLRPLAPLSSAGLPAHSWPHAPQLPLAPPSCLHLERGSEFFPGRRVLWPHRPDRRGS